MTKRMLKDSLIELLDVEPLNKVTIKSICENADVNRTTFYAYYDTIEQLLGEIEQDVLDRIPFCGEGTVLTTSGELEDNLTGFFEYVRENNVLFNLLLFKTDQMRFNLHLMQRVMDTYRSKNLIGDGFCAEYEYVFCVNGVIGLMKHWVTNKFPFSARKLAEMCVRLCVSGGDGSLSDFEL